MSVSYNYHNLDRDLPALSPPEQACVLSGLLCLELELITELTKHPDDPLPGTAQPFVRLTDLLGRLSKVLDPATTSSVRDVHQAAGRKIYLDGRCYGSYCEAALLIGRQIYSVALRTAADPDVAIHWLDPRKQSALETFPLIPTEQIEQHWAEVATTVSEVPSFDSDELLLGIQDEHRHFDGQTSAVMDDIAGNAEVWSIEPGGFHFQHDGRREFFKLAGKPLDCLRIIVASPNRQTFSYDDFREMWESDYEPEGFQGVIRTHLATLRRCLKDVVKVFSLEVKNPLPHSRGGGWGFSLPR